MFLLGLATLVYMIATVRSDSQSRSANNSQSQFVPPAKPRYAHPSFKPTRSDWQPQPKPDTKAYRGSAAIRIKPNRHQAKRNKA